MITLVSPTLLAQTSDALIARLQVCFPPTLFTHNLVPAKVTPLAWKILTRRCPFVGLGWDTISESDNARLFNGQSHWTAFFVTKNVSGIRGRVYGDELGPGLFTMIEAGVAMLHGFTIPGIGSVQVKAANNVSVDGWEDDEMAVGTVNFDVGYTLAKRDALTLDVNDDGYFDTLGIDWNFGGDTVLSDIDQVRTGTP